VAKGFSGFVGKRRGDLGLSRGLGVCVEFTNGKEAKSENCNLICNLGAGLAG
jgi:hypothetical protein